MQLNTIFGISTGEKKGGNSHKSVNVEAEEPRDAPEDVPGLAKPSSWHPCYFACEFSVPG